MCKQQSFGLEVRPVVFVCICLHHGFSLIVYPDWQPRNSWPSEVREIDLKIVHGIKFKSKFFRLIPEWDGKRCLYDIMKGKVEERGGRGDFLLRPQLSQQSVFLCCLLWTHNFQDLHIIRMLRRWPSERRQFYRAVNISCTNWTARHQLFEAFLVYSRHHHGREGGGWLTNIFHFL